TGSFATAAAATTAGTPAVNPFQTIERRDIGLTLRIKPQISEGSAIRLEIYQEVSSIDPTARAGASDLVTTKRSLETKVVVDDGMEPVAPAPREPARAPAQDSPAAPSAKPPAAEASPAPAKP